MTAKKYICNIYILILIYTQCHTYPKFLFNRYFSNSYVGSLEREPNYFENIISVKELSYDMTTNYVVNIYFPINGLKEFSEVNQKYFCDSGRIMYYQFILDTGKNKGGFGARKRKLKVYCFPLFQKTKTKQEREGEREEKRKVDQN